MIFCVFLAVLFALWYFLSRRPTNFPPGPDFVPFLGNYFSFSQTLQEVKYYHLVFEEWSKQYGDIVGFKLGSNLAVCVNSSELVQEVLNNADFDGRPLGYFFRLRTFGKRLGLVFSDGLFWKKQRKFTVQNLRVFGLNRPEMEDKIQFEVQSLLNTLRRRDLEDPVYLHNFFDISVLNVLWAMVTGRRFPLDDSRLKKLLKLIHEAFKLVDMSGGILNQFPFLRFFVPELSGYNKNMELLTNMWRFLEETIEDHKKNPQNDLVQAYLDKMKEDKSFDEKQLISTCLDLFMAGSETTSNTLGFICIYLILFPEVQRKIHEEIDDKIGVSRLPRLKDRESLVYTQAFLLEIQRITNVPPLGIAHRALKTTKLKNYTIPKNTLVLTNLYSVHMDKTYWTTPERFLPERFLDEAGKISFDEKHFIPFGSGRRRCLGESLGKSSIFLFTVGLLQQFRLEASPEEPHPQMEGLNGFTLSPKPFQAKLVARS